MYPLASNDFKGEHAEGGGGPGPAGGGGGGSGGDEGAAQHLQFVRLKPVADAAAAVVPPAPVVVPPPKQVIPPVTTVPQAAAAAPQPDASAATAGPGSGNTGTAGSGPGSGGGIGSGTGPGTGSGAGAGTGGGPAGSYPPSPTQFFLPPLPAPSSLKGFHLVAWFDVDEKGHASLLGFNPSPDRSYNGKLRDVLLSLRFRPGVKADGTPVRDTVDIQFIF